MKSVAVVFLTFSSMLSAAPRLGLSTNTLPTVNIATATNGPAQTVQAFNLGDGSLNPGVTSTASWLVPTVGAKTACSQPGGSCYPINISLNTSSLAAGTYTEYVTVSDPNAIDSPQDIAVTVNTNGVSGAISAYVGLYGTPNALAVYPVFTKGSGVQAAVTTQSGGNWLAFTSGMGIVNFPSPYLIDISARPGQAAGTYTGTVVLSGSSVASDNKTITVTLTVTSSPIIETDNIAPVRLSAYPGASPQISSVTFTNLGQGTLAITGASSASKLLSATVTSGNTIQISADPTGLATGVYSGSVTLVSNAANNTQVSVPVELAVAPAGQPMISNGGLVNAANFAHEAVSQGDIVALFGTQMAAPGTSAVNAGPPPLATTLAGTQVLVNGVPAPLYYVSPGQINFQVPYSLSTSQVAAVQVVSNGVPGNTRSLIINASSPRFLSFASFIQGGYGVIINASDNSLPLPSGTNVPGFVTHPAKAGDTLIVYGVGFGQTTPAAVEGVAASSTTLQTVSNTVATFGGGFLGNGAVVNAAFSGLAPTAVGLYQVNVTIPANPPLGNSIPLSVTVNGVESNVVQLAISANGK